MKPVVTDFLRETLVIISEASYSHWPEIKVPESRKLESKDVKKEK
jgi:hypothetical protein